MVELFELFKHGTVKGSRFKTANVVVELFELFKHGTVKGSWFKTANVVVELFELFEHGTKTLSAAYSFAPSVT